MTLQNFGYIIRSESEVKKLNIGDRIKKIRKELDLTQQRFGERLGVKGNTIAQYELGRSNPVDSVISLMIREFNVSEDWLRYGKGEMFKPAPSDVLDQLASEYNLSNASYIAIEKFVNLKPEKRNELIEFFLDISKAILESDVDPSAAALPENFAAGFSEDSLIQAFVNAPKTPEELEKEFPAREPDRNKETG